ncbi:MAG: hypothetical protein H0V41_05705 [Pseudonocardiales bacterium]|nr:hypothetical protein [Pseudonocardiales bacterium]
MCGPLGHSDWEDRVDHLTIRSCDRVAAARVPKLGRVDVFAPEGVVWAYEGPAECTVRALLNLVHPQHPDAPTGVYRRHAPPGPPTRAAPDDNPASARESRRSTRGPARRLVTTP